ncbi:alpha/beta fold hydrolase [Luteimonas kalidii]|uniref:Alpha/beta hydrolase n=1 Tax=Luteimonas kalidii TaxID=3042025 RepID=A0ABT6JRH3_9GAMM|nr:alpha/beta hydrolase [Luteimonas kalidii]MDH5833283.1 alpha/beta hydrolase [Luteimonas kalidii]
MNPQKLQIRFVLAVCLLACTLGCALAAPALGAAGPDDDAVRARAVMADLLRIPSPAGVQETYRTPIRGVDHWISIRGQDRANPVVLFVHGGPASPSMPSLWQWQRPLEEYFTMVHYDQRGAGKTYREDHSDALADSLRIQTYVDDLVAIAEHLRARLGQEKLVLMAHSWGTIPAMHAALARPDLFRVYVGIGQVIDVRENERISLAFGLAEAKRRGDAQALREMEALLPYPGDAPLTRERIVAARKWPQHYGGMAAFRDETNPWYYGAARLSPDYDDEDRAAINAGSLFTLGRLLDEYVKVDFSDVRRFPIPVVMLMGRHDYTTPSQPTADWLQRVDAPYKRGVWFERSAHMVPWEEPGKMLVTMLEVVRPLVRE